MGIPIYGCDPDLLPLASKSGGRKLLRAAGVPIADGAEDIADTEQLAEALGDLKRRNPETQRAVVKLNEGFSGEGNAVFNFGDAPLDHGLRPGSGAGSLKWPSKPNRCRGRPYKAKVGEMGATAEEFIEGAQKHSSSAQFRVDPLGAVNATSTHDQALGGPSGQVFLGCRFPADPAYRLEIQAAGLRAAKALRDHGVLGRFGVDFVSVRVGDGWRHYGIEINLRKGGTTHPFLMLQFLTDGQYDEDTGAFRIPSGRPRCYEASDNLEAARYCGLTPDDLIEIAVMNGLHFHGATQEGVVFHLLGALSQFGKFGLIAVAETPARARCSLSGRRLSARQGSHRLGRDRPRRLKGMVRLRPNGHAGLVRELGQQEGSSVTRATVSADGETITVHIPLTFRKRGGRKLVVTLDGAEWAPRPRVDNAMVKALARAFRWRKTVDEGMHATPDDLARAKGAHATYVSRVLRLTLIAPEIVQAILDARQPADLQLDDLLEGFRWSGRGNGRRSDRQSDVVAIRRTETLRT